MYTRERVPLDWAGTQNNLGTALSELGRTGDRNGATLSRAVDTYHAAVLEVYTRERVPLDWAMTQNNLGNCPDERWENGKPERSALSRPWTPTGQHLRCIPVSGCRSDWAMTQSNLGAALTSLGEREAGTERLEQAVDAHRAALQERTRERVPLDWAMTQNNLGNVLTSLGEREAGTERLEQAVDTYRAALEVYAPVSGCRSIGPGRRTTSGLP